MLLENILEFDLLPMEDCDEIGKKGYCLFGECFCNVLILTMLFAVRLLVVIFQKFLDYFKKTDTSFVMSSSAVYPDKKCKFLILQKTWLTEGWNLLFCMMDLLRG